MKPTTRDWLTFARKDLVNCEHILQDEFLTNIVAFHAQQAVEKSLKAIIEELELGFIRTHNIIQLSETVRPHIPLEFDAEMIATLNEVYTESRYPGEFGILPHGNPTPEEANGFYEFALNMFGHIETYLSERVEIEQSGEQPEEDEEKAGLKI